MSLSPEDEREYAELEEWRKRIAQSNTEAERARGQREIKTLKDSLRAFYKKAELKALQKNKDVLEVWPGIVGPEIDDITHVDTFRGGILTVQVQSAAMKQELETFYSDSLLESLRIACPEKRIQRIRFVLAP